MKLIFASDSFKGSLSAPKICDLLERVAARHFPDAQIVSIPVADGGEGTVDALLRAIGGRRMQKFVNGPLFEMETAQWGMLDDGVTAVIEMAQTSGLPYVPASQRDPRKTTSLGLGQLIAEAIRHGARKLFIGIGGSATNDGGIGMLQALGATFTDTGGVPVQPVGGALKYIENIDFSGLLPELKETQITVICDVTNPLLGENGATFVYGPQKGATPQICDELEAGMCHYAQMVSAAIGKDIASFPGAGAAGGMGAALGGVLNATLKSGIDAVLDAVGFDKKLIGASLVITGEGCMDGQSIRFGKVPVGVARRCAARKVPVAAIVGSIGEGAASFFDLCESTIQTTVSGPMNLEQAMQNASALYEQAADRLFRAIKIGLHLKDSI